MTTEDGLIGWGEGGQYGPPEPVAACIKDVFAPLIVGQSIDHPARIWENLYAFSRDFGQKGTYVEALSAIDICLWDLLGKSLGRPIWSLLGGAFRDRIRAYATGFYYPEYHDDDERLLSELKTEATSYVSTGFSVLKMKIGLLSVERDLQRVEAVRRNIGAGVKILVDANHAYNAATAIRIGRHLEKYDVQWFEEPVVPEDRAGYRRVRDEIAVPIAGGECEFTRFGFRDLFLAECVDIAQPDLCVCGGFSEWQKIQALASSFGVMTVPHVWGSGVALAAALHALATIPPSPHTANPVALQNEPVIEYDRKHNPLRDDLLVNNFRLSDGCLAVPKGAGLGIEVDEATLKEFTESRGPR